MDGDIASKMDELRGPSSLQLVSWHRKPGITSISAFLGLVRLPKLIMAATVLGSTQKNKPIRPNI